MLILRSISVSLQRLMNPPSERSNYSNPLTENEYTHNHAPMIIPTFHAFHPTFQLLVAQPSINRSAHHYTPLTLREILIYYPGQESKLNPAPAPATSRSLNSPFTPRAAPSVRAAREFAAEFKFSPINSSRARGRTDEILISHFPPAPIAIARARAAFLPRLGTTTAPLPIPAATLNRRGGV